MRRVVLKVESRDFLGWSRKNENDKRSHAVPKVSGLELDKGMC